MTADSNQQGQSWKARYESISEGSSSGKRFRLTTKAMIAKVTAMPLITNTHSEDIGAGSRSPRRMLCNCPKKLAYPRPHAKAQAAARKRWPLRRSLARAPGCIKQESANNVIVKQTGRRLLPCAPAPDCFRKRSQYATCDGKPAAELNRHVCVPILTTASETTRIAGRIVDLLLVWRGCSYYKAAQIQYLAPARLSPKIR